MGELRPMGKGWRVELRRTAGARRMTLRVSRLDGRVTLTVPPHVPDAEAEAFVAAKSEWIERNVAQSPDRNAVGIGTRLPVRGHLHEVVAGPGRAARIDGDRIFAPDRAAGPAIAALLKGIARDRLSAAIDAHAAGLGVRAGRLTLRDTRSRWGSCTADGNLMLSWRLAMAPDAVADYVALHEVAHLIRMDHSPDFWALVASRTPDWKRHRDWLRTDGAALHAYRFGV